MAGLRKYFRLIVFIFFGLARINNAIADRPSVNDQCATFVPIKVSNLTNLCKQRAIDNMNAYYSTVLHGKWVGYMKHCERDLIQYLTYKFLPPHHAKAFNKNLNKAMELYSEITRKSYCGDFIGCGNFETVVTNSYLQRSMRVILHAVVEELNEKKMRQNLCNWKTEVTHSSGQNNKQDHETTGTGSPQKAICHDTIMTLCREESKKKQDRSHSKNTTYNKEEYIKCLVNYTSKSIHEEYPQASLKFKRGFGILVKGLNCELKNMFTELYCTSDESPCKSATDNRTAENIEKISEQLIELPFMYTEECLVSDDLPPDEELNDDDVQKFRDYVNQLSDPDATRDPPICFYMILSWRIKQYTDGCRVSDDLPSDEELNDDVVQKFRDYVNQLSDPDATIDPPISFSLKLSWRVKQ